MTTASAHQGTRTMPVMGSGTEHPLQIAVRVVRGSELRQ
jgi:hypothetical protein